MEVRKRPLLFSGIIMLALALILAGCGSKQESPKDTGAKAQTTYERAKSQGFVSVGFANEAPFAFATPEGKLTGFNVEVARAVLTKMGIKEMNGVLTEFGSLIPGLKAKRFDIITAGMYITPERSKEADFANPEYTIGGALAVRKGNPHNLHGYKDIAANPKVKIAVMGGGAEYDHLTAVGVTKDQIITVPDQPSALAALQAKRVDAITMSSPALKNLLETVKDANIDRVEDFVIAEVNGKRQQGFGSAAFRQEDDDFREAYNLELENMKKSGELLEILKKFGFTEHELPGSTTMEEAVKNW